MTDVVGQEGEGPARRAVGLADRLRDVLGVVGRAAQVDAVGGEIHRPQLHVGLLEKVVRTQGHLEQLGDVLGCPRWGITAAARATMSASMASSMPRT